MVAPAVAGAAGAKAAVGAKEVVGSFFNGAGAFVFVNWVLEKIGGKIPTNFDKWWNGYKKKSKVQFNTDPAKHAWKECEKILASNLHKITEHKDFFSEILNIDIGDDDYSILKNQKVKLFITLSKNLRIKEKTIKEKIKKSQLQKFIEEGKNIVNTYSIPEQEEKPDKDKKEKEKPDKDKKDEKENKKEEEIEIEIKEYFLYFEPEESDEESEKTEEGYLLLKEVEEKKEVTKDQFKHFKPLLEKEEGVWKFKHGGEKISLYLKTEKDKHSNTMDTILYTDDKKYNNFIKKLHVLLKRQELNDDMFNKSKKENVLLNIDTEKIPDPSLRNLIINILGFLIVVASVVLAVKLVITATVGICLGILGWCFMNYG